MSESISGDTSEIINKVRGTERLRDLGRYDEAINILKGVRRDHQLEYENNIETRRLIEEQIASISADKAQKLYEQGEHREASSLYINIFENSGDNLGELDQIRYKSLAALRLLEMGEYMRSYTMFKEVASRQAESLGPTDRALLSTQSNMARALERLERFDESLALCEDVLDKLRSNYGNDDWLTMPTQGIMGIVLLKTGAARGAFEQFKDSFEKNRRIFGPKDTETLASQNNMAMALIALNRPTEAFNIFTEVLIKRMEKLGSNHPDTLQSQGSIGLVLIKQAKFSQALRSLNQVLAEQKSILGDTHPDTQACLSYIELIRELVGQRKFAELQSSYEEDDNLTKLLVLISSGDVSGVNDLLDSGFDIGRITAMKGNTPLHIAVNKNNIGIIESVLKHAKRHLKPRELRDFVDAKTTSAAGNTAMHIAASNGSLGAMRVLLEYGATFNIKNKRGKTPRELASDSNIESFLSGREDL